jgi:hypothetical protein
MRFDSAESGHLQSQLTALGGYRVAPVAMWGGLLLLAGAEEIRRALAQSTEADGITTWRVIALTDTRVIYATASKARLGWDAYDSEHEDADSIETWARPLSAVVSVALTDQRTQGGRNRFDSRRSWSMGVRLDFADGANVAVPPFDTALGEKAQQEIETAVRWIAQRLWREK